MVGAAWWERHGRQRYPGSRQSLLLCDGGGGNASNRYVFKEALPLLADRLGLEIRVAHYPPYCSKHNPSEHRLFPHLTRACQGVVFHSVAIAKPFMERAKTSTGLKVDDHLRRFPATMELSRHSHGYLISGSYFRPNPNPLSRLRFS